MSKYRADNFVWTDDDVQLLKNNFGIYDQLSLPLSLFGWGLNV